MIINTIESKKKFKNSTFDNTVMDCLKENLKWFRKRKGWSQEEMAAVYSLTRAKIVSYEVGTAQPGLQLLADICKELDIQLHIFLTEDLKTYKAEAGHVLHDDGGTVYMKNKDQLLHALEQQLQNTKDMISLLQAK